MTGRLSALILLTTVYLIQTAEVPQRISLTAVEVGDNVTLQCPVSELDRNLFYWYKQPLGHVVQTLARGTYSQLTRSAQFHNSRFNVTKGPTRYLLTIRNVSKEDEATYFCQSGTSYSQSFVNGTFLAVNDGNLQKSVNVKQSPETASVQPGGSVTLQCSLLSKNKENRVQCPDEHSVYWFRAGSGESHPSVIYTHRNSSDEHVKRSCVYSLSKTIQSSSDTGTYYCAVATCGEILFGEGTKVETRRDLDPIVVGLGVLLAFCVTVIVLLVFCVNRRRLCEHCKEASHKPGHDMSTMDQSTELDGDAEVVNYAALDFSTRKVKRMKKKMESPQECVYSAVRADYHTQHHPAL